MIDLNEPEMQSTFKKLERTTLVTNITMCVVTILAAAIAVWGSTTSRENSSWSEIMFYVLIGALAVYFAALLIWEIILRRKNAKAMHAYISEGFFAAEEFLSGGDLSKGAEKLEFEMSLAGDKLVVMHSDSGNFVEFDLSPIRNYSSVCDYSVRLARRFVRDYYSLAAQNGGIDSVTLTNRVQGRGKTYVFVENGKPKYEFLLKISYYIRHGIIK